MATKNKVKFGLKNVHYALLQEGEEGTITYGTPVPMPGAITLLIMFLPQITAIRAIWRLP